MDNFQSTNLDDADNALDSGYHSEAGSEYYAGDISALVQNYEEPVEIATQPDPSSSHDVNEGRKYQLSKKRKEPESPASSDGQDHQDFSLKRAKTAAADDFDLNAATDINRPYLIAHCPKIQSLMKQMQLSSGVRYELARLITAGKLTYADITQEKLKALKGPNAVAAPKIAQVFLRASDSSDSILAVNAAFAREIAVLSPWSELDREEAALARGPYEGLGNNAEEPGWYGGKVLFSGRLKSSAQGRFLTKSYEIILDSCTLGPSCRFTRRFGSWSFIRVKIPQDTLHGSNDLNAFFKKPFVIWGQVYRACYAKRDNILLYQTNEMYPLGPTIPGRLSLEDLINWHNPVESNSRQLMTKWSSRMALGFSNSVPGPRIVQENLLEEIDIMSEQDSDMTDGCGISTKSIHRAILNQLSLLSLPTAFQFRLAGCKGMLLMADDEKSRDDIHRTWVRPSQTKIKYPKELALDPAMLTFDILRTSRLTTPSKISSEIIVNLAENGVPHKVFVDLLKTTIREIVEGLTTWDGPDAMYKLWVNVERAGGVISARRAREAVGEARARGYTNRSPEDIELEEDNDEDSDESSEVIPRSVAWWADQISGSPSSLFDTVMTLLDSGFRPQECPVLREKLRMVVTNKIEGRTQNPRFEVLESCIAFAVPDPYQVLGPEEIQIKSSRRNLTGQDGLLTDVILGDVLIGRNPCKLPSDIRKVKAVDHPMLRNFVDVIVFSVQGYRRLIDFLAGGDYDGDTVLAIWNPLMTTSFQNADEKYSKDPQGLEHAFIRDTETGATFLEKIAPMDSIAKAQAMQTYLLGALCDPSLIGIYSVMHNNTIYKYGYGHPRTHKIAAKFGRVMDASKTGYRIKPETLTADKRDYYQAQPQWAVSSKKDKKIKSAQSRFDTTNMSHLKRDENSPHVHGIFIMDQLIAAAEAEKVRLLIEMETLFAPLYNEPDPDLVAPWMAAVAWAEDNTLGPEIRKRKKRELAQIAEHVKSIYKRERTVFRKRAKADQNPRSRFTELPIEVRQDELRSLSRAFVTEGPQIGKELLILADDATLSRWRASYAYLYDAEQNFKNGKQGWSRFPWNVAFRALCTIKAAALGPYQVVTNSFYERFKLVNPR